MLRYLYPVSPPLALTFMCMFGDINVAIRCCVTASGEYVAAHGVLFAALLSNVFNEVIGEPILWNDPSQLCGERCRRDCL